MEAKRRRQMMTLGMLCVVAGVLITTRLISQPPASVSASSRATSADVGAWPDLESPRVSRIDVTWPVSLQRDLFDWEPVLGPAPQPKKPVVVETGPDASSIRRQAARSIRLGGILMDQPPKALINGSIWLQGQTVDGFLIKRIDPRRVVLENQGVEIEVEL